MRLCGSKLPVRGSAQLRCTRGQRVSPLVSQSQAQHGLRRTVSTKAAPTEQEDSIKKTVSALDALLGITDDDASKGNKASTKEASPASASSSIEASSSTTTTTQASSPSTSGRTSNKQEQEMEDQFQKIIEKARQLGSAQANKPGNLESQQQQLRQEFESLLQAMSKDQVLLDKDDIKRLKEACFGPMTFWVTEVVTLQEAERTGVLVRGNLRDDRNKVFDLVVTKVKELFDGKYEVIMVEDADPADADTPVSPAQAARGPKVAFQIVPVAQTVPKQAGAFQQIAGVGLFALFVASSLQLALVSNITKLPKETLEYFANPDNFNSNPEQLPPGLETWDPTTYFVTAIPVFLALLGINVVHELGHRIAAAIRGVKLGPSYFIPNLQLGSFGAITPFASLLKNRSQMWDVAAAGPLAGMLASFAVLLVGLSQSTPGVLPKELLVPVPSALFQGSLLLGTLTKALLGGDALRGNEEVLVSPFVIAGWCGLITTALNLLPVGSLDGGRLTQAAFGKQALSLSSFFTFVGLGLGFLGGSLSLPFGLYVVICQRTAENYIQDNVSPTSDPKRTATAVAVLTAILILVPMAPEFAEQLGVGPTNPFL